MRAYCRVESGCVKVFCDLVRMRRVSTTLRDIAEDALGEVGKLGAKYCWRVLNSATKWVSV